MSLLSAINLSKSYGAVDIFDGISLSIPQRARIGLVGANGVGKTTLFRILAGFEDSTSGEVIRSRGLRIGYLPQDVEYDSNLVLWDAMREMFDELTTRQKELARLEAMMVETECDESIFTNYGRLQQEFERLGGYTYEVRIRQVLSGLGFVQEDYQHPLSQLSGGERTRALLARILLSDFQLLLLDEPTNSLDIEAVEWLESYIKDYAGAVVCISHDRFFLDQVVNTIWDMMPQLEVYRGNYSSYVLQSDHRHREQLLEYQSQQAFIEKEEEYIRRNIAGQNTRQAQGRRKRLERFLEEAKTPPKGDGQRLGMKLNQSRRSGDLIIQTRGLAIGYGDDGKELFKVPDLVFTRGECAALIGPNGVGKTTFLKTLFGDIPPLAGEAYLGSSLKIGFFAQAHENLHREYTLIDEILHAAPVMNPAEARAFLAKYQFTGDDVYKTVSVLSGGERGRLALACLELNDANFLLLDEPTNHLDLHSQEILQTVLSEYEGTILLVSHDRYLVDALATQIWHVISEDGKLEVFKGSYSEYRDKEKIELVHLAEKDVNYKEKKPEPDLHEKQRVREEKRRIQRQQQLENEISILEVKMSEISRLLEQPQNDMGEVERLGKEYMIIKQSIEDMMDEWVSLS